MKDRVEKALQALEGVPVIDKDIVARKMSELDPKHVPAEKYREYAELALEKKWD